MKSGRFGYLEIGDGRRDPLAGLDEVNSLQLLDKFQIFQMEFGDWYRLSDGAAPKNSFYEQLTFKFSNKEIEADILLFDSALGEAFPSRSPYTKTLDLNPGDNAMVYREELKRYEALLSDFSQLCTDYLGVRIELPPRKLDWEFSVILTRTNKPSFSPKTPLSDLYKYIIPPKGQNFLESLGAPPNSLLHVIKSLYGMLESAGYCWSTMRNYHVNTLGMKQTIFDQCLFYKQDKSVLEDLQGFLVEDTIETGPASFA
eukprot:IDg16733t1